VIASSESANAAPERQEATMDDATKKVFDEQTKTLRAIEHNTERMREYLRSIASSLEALSKEARQKQGVHS
jgi:hypothetical protein